MFPTWVAFTFTPDKQYTAGCYNSPWPTAPWPTGDVPSRDGKNSLLTCLDLTQLKVGARFGAERRRIERLTGTCTPVLHRSERGILIYAQRCLDKCWVP